MANIWLTLREHWADAIAVYPALSAVAMAGLATWATLKSSRARKRQRRFIAAFAVLGVTSIIAVIWNQMLLSRKEGARDDAARERAQKIDSRDKVIQELNQKLDAVQMGMRGFSENPQLSLRARATLLSVEILAWQTEKEAHEPPIIPPRSAGFEEGRDAWFRFMKDSDREFTARFGSRLSALKG